MTEKDWNLLLTLYQEKTITKAAERLYISQPALTYRIKQIEKEFDSQIIYRGKKGIVFTKEGEYLVQHAKEMTKKLRETKELLNNLKDNTQGILRIGVSSNFALYQLPDLLEKFLNRYPNIEVNLTTGWSSDINKLIQNEEVHIAILRGQFSWNYESFAISSETLAVSSRREIDLENLPKQNLINYQTDIHLKNTFEDWWSMNYEVPPKVLMEVDKIETCKELVKKGLGYSIFPRVSLKDSDNLYTHDLEINGKKIYRTTWLLYKQDLLQLNVVNAFVQFVREYYNVKN